MHFVLPVNVDGYFMDYKSSSWNFSHLYPSPFSLPCTALLPGFPGLINPGYHFSVTPRSYMFCQHGDHYR